MAQIVACGGQCEGNWQRVIWADWRLGSCKVPRGEQGHSGEEERKAIMLSISEDAALTQFKVTALLEMIVQ